MVMTKDSRMGFNINARLRIPAIMINTLAIPTRKYKSGFDCSTMFLGSPPNKLIAANLTMTGIILVRRMKGMNANNLPRG